MSQVEPRRRMTGADAMFLYFERKEMPLHIGSVAVVGGAFDEECERILAARLPEIPRYRQRVLFSPMNLTHPCWEYDPAFDIRNHIRRVRLDPPGSEQQLVQVSGEVFTELMDRSRPLWDLTVVDGLEGGRSALISRVHHSMMDGISGIELVKVLFDTTKEPRRVEPKPYCPPPLPDSRQVLVEGLAGVWSDMASRVIGAQVSALHLFQSYVAGPSRESLRGLLDSMPELLRPAERLPFNRPCSGVRGHCWSSFPFAEMRAMRGPLGGTINDIVLTTVAGAISRYVTAHREPLHRRFARLLVPVNLRSSDDHESAGNAISMLPLSVPLEIADPVQRMRTITARSAAMKSARIADVVSLIGNALGWLPPALQESLAAMPFLPQPVLMFNMVCTNVPGPMIPLYANGREVLAYYPHVPCGSEVGISVAVSSYNRHMHFGVTYDGQAAPDGELFRDFLVESFEELRMAAGVAASPPHRQQKVAAAPATPAAEPQPAAEQPHLTAKARKAPPAREPAAVATVVPAPPRPAATLEPVAADAESPAVPDAMPAAAQLKAPPPSAQSHGKPSRVRRRKASHASAGSR